MSDAPKNPQNAPKKKNDNLSLPTRVEGVAERSRMLSAGMLGSAAYYLIAALSAVVALSGLGIDFTIITVVVTVILASVGVGLAMTAMCSTRLPAGPA